MWSRREEIDDALQRNTLQTLRRPWPLPNPADVSVAGPLPVRAAVHRGGETTCYLPGADGVNRRAPRRHRTVEDING